MNRQKVVSVVVEDDMLEWLEEKRETPYGKLQLSEVVRTVIRNAMNTA